MLGWFNAVQRGCIAWFYLSFTERTTTHAIKYIFPQHHHPYKYLLPRYHNPSTKYRLPPPLTMFAGIALKWVLWRPQTAHQQKHEHVAYIPVGDWHVSVYLILHRNRLQGFSFISSRVFHWMITINNVVIKLNLFISTPTGPLLYDGNQNLFSSNFFITILTK